MADTSWFNCGLRIHLAGYYNGKAAVYDLIERYPWYLESYHYIGHNERFAMMIRDNQKIVPRHKIFLDSGAFSMFTQGIDVDIPAYVDYIKTHGDIIEAASVLDGIGDPKLTFENQKILEDSGVEVLPCFHYGEPIEYLEYYIKHYDYITLGGMVPISTPDLRKWLDYIWEHYLTDEHGWPILKVHGFGLTSLSLMERYPWFSVDSTSWVLTGRYGSIFFPTDDRPDGKMIMSDMSPARKDMDRHYDTLSPPEREAVDQVIGSYGYDPEELRSIYWKRDLWNVDFFHRITDKQVEPFIHEEQGLFDAF